MIEGADFRATRRTVLWTGAAAVATAVATAVIPTRAGAQTKIAPKLVQYRETPKGPQQCDNCIQFVAPASCKVVEGKINAKGWCQLYAPTPKSS